MKRLAAASLSAGLLMGAPALAKAPTAQHAHQYRQAYSAVAHKFGRRAPGRNILRWGTLRHRAATDAEIVRSLGVLQGMLAPAPAPAATPPAGDNLVSSPAAVTAAPSGGGGLPACASESGTNYSTGPANTNPSSGATGRYQIIPSTAASYGCNLSTPAGQDACAQAIYAHQGAGAWVGCGG